MAAIRAWSGPTRVAIRGLSWFPNTQFGHPPRGSAASYSEIKRAIIEVATKGYYLNNFVNRILLKKSHVRTKTIPSLNTEITLNDREREVVRYICMEFTAQEIAQKIDVSPRTVEAIKDRLMERFGAKNTAGLVFFAVKNNLID